MKILYDYQVFEGQKYGGISRYFIKLLSQYENDKNHHFELPIRYSSNEYLEELPYLKNQIKGNSNFFDEFAWGLSFRGKYRLFDLKQKLTKNLRTRNNSNRLLSIEVLKKGSFDIFHPTYYNTYHLPYLKKKPLVITVHDMIHELYPQYFVHDLKTTRDKKTLCERADKIIAVSQSTRNDLIRIFGIEESKIDVIYHGNSLDVKDYQKTKLNSQPFILYVGNRATYKNFNSFVSSCADVLIKYNLQLICCGGGNFKEDEKKLFRQLKIDKIVRFFEADDNTLINLYSNALLFVFPSLYEGFGIPVLEAMSCGCPMLLSSKGSLPEIAGDAAVYFDPDNTLQMTASLEKIITDNELRETLAEHGKKRSLLFSWDITYQKTIETYQSIS